MRAEIIVAAGNKLVKHIYATDSVDDELVQVRRRGTRLEIGWHQGGDGRVPQTEKILKPRERRGVHVGWVDGVRSERRIRIAMPAWTLRQVEICVAVVGV